MARKLPYLVGDEIAIPFVGGWALAVIARADGKGRVLGYFFSPALASLPSEPVRLDPDSAVYIARFGHLGLTRGDWRVIGPTPNFRVDRWAIPNFGSPIEMVEGRGYRVAYDDQLRETAREVVPLAEIAELPQDGLAGSGFIEARLARLLKHERLQYPTIA